MTTSGERSESETRRVDLSEVDWRVYVVLDPSKIPADDHRGFGEVARAAVAGGAGVVQLRDKHSSGRRLVDRARRLQAICRDGGALCVVNDRLDVALAAGVDGVHLGPEDIPVADARRVAPELVIGGSAGTLERARRLVDEGVDYLGCGAVYDAGPSKPDASEPRGPEAIGEIARAVEVPVVGIGGVTAENAPAVVRAGARGVAVIRYVVASEEPAAAARRLLEALEEV